MIDCPRCGRVTFKAVFAETNPLDRGMADEPLYRHCIACGHREYVDEM